jgi:hypothetical protein
MKGVELKKCHRTVALGASSVPGPSCLVSTNPEFYPSIPEKEDKKEAIK